MVKNRKLKNRKRMYKLFLGFSGLYIVFMFVVGTIIYQLVSTKIKNNLERKETALVADLDILINEAINQVNSDVTFLAKQTELFYLNDPDEFTRHLKETYLVYSKYKKIYDQIRFIDLNGNEQVRINYNKGKPTVVADKHLQNKKNRYYFTDILGTSRDSIYYSPFDLNIENDEIEKPIKPMLRIGTPIFDKNNNKLGILVLNLLGETILKIIDRIEPLSESSIFLTNLDGFYLKSPNPQQEWGFMFNNKTHNINVTFPNESPDIYKEKKGCFFSGSGYFCYNTIYPFIPEIKTQNNSTRLWKIISYTPNNLIEAYIREEYPIWINILWASVIPVIILFWFLARNIQLKTEASENLVKSNNELKDLNATKDKFFSILAHDLRNPFSAILGFSKLLADQSTELSVHEYKRIGHSINKSAQTAFELLDNLLTWALSQRGSITYAPQQTVLYNEVRKVTNLVKANAESKKIHINNCIPPTLTVYADVEMIKTIFRNLVSNAIKFTNPSGLIHIFCDEASQNGFVEIGISDTGVGIPDKEIKKIFELGEKVTTKGTAKEEGSGLGLILCKEFIEKHGGTLSVESEEGKGSTFKFTLPQIN